MKKKIVTNLAKKVIVTIIKDSKGKYVGKAKCDEDDTFNVEVGEKISLLRGKIKRLKTHIIIENVTLRKSEAKVNEIKNVIDDKKLMIAKLELELNEYLKTV